MAQPRQRRKRKLTPDTVAQIQTRRKAGLSYEAIAKECGLAVGTVFAACRMPDPSAEPDRGSAPDLELPPDVAAELDGLAPDARRELIGQRLLSVNRAAQAAHVAGDVGSELAASRVVAALDAALTKNAPPPEPADPNDHPDMVEAAGVARKKLGEYGERARLGKSQGPARVGPSNG